MRRYSGYLFLAPYLLAFGGFLVLPLLYGLGLSVSRWEMLSPAPAKFIGFGNYLEALGDEYFWQATWATVRFVALQVPLGVGVALLFALGINAVPRQLQAFCRASYFFPTLISISVAGILWRWFYNGEFGLFNAWLARIGLRAPWISDVDWAMKSIVLMTLWWTVGGAMVILLAGLQHIPDRYYEAAASDGASRPRIYFGRSSCRCPSRRWPRWGFSSSFIRGTISSGRWCSSTRSASTRCRWAWRCSRRRTTPSTA